MKVLEKIIQSGKSVFTIDDLKSLLDTDNENVIRNTLSKAGKGGSLIRLAYGVWGLKRFDRYEFACKVNKNSYISFETVLKNTGIIFQHYGNTIFLASNTSREKHTNEGDFKTYKIKDSILVHPLGIIHHDNYAIATVERAICDRLYISPGYYFDNLDGVNRERLENISQIYNKRVIKEVQSLIKKYA